MFYYEPIELNSELTNRKYELFIYPTPISAGESLFVDGLSEKEMHYSIYTLDGKSVQEGKKIMPAEIENIIIGNIKPGLYILNIRQGLNSFNKKINITL